MSLRDIGAKGQRQSRGKKKSKVQHKVVTKKRRERGEGKGGGASSRARLGSAQLRATVVKCSGIDSCFMIRSPCCTVLQQIGKQSRAAERPCGRHMHAMNGWPRPRSCRAALSAGADDDRAGLRRMLAVCVLHGRGHRCSTPSCVLPSYRLADLSASWQRKNTAKPRGRGPLSIRAIFGDQQEIGGQPLCYQCCVL